VAFTSDSIRVGSADRGARVPEVQAGWIGESEAGVDLGEHGLQPQETAPDGEDGRRLGIYFP
jgi:hypothetical protein